ncbi:MAG: MoaD/ThiS family protein [Bacteroidota bacterium]
MDQSTQLLCFGVARDITGSATVSLPLGPGASIAAVRKALLQAYPAFAELVSFAIARNEAYAEDDEVLAPGDTLAIIPPVSGG